MNEDNKNISLDDISFDDMIDGGVELETAKVEPEAVVEEVENTEAEQELDADVEEAKKEEPKEEPEDIVEEKEEVESSEDDTIVSEIITKLGFETEEEYEDTSEGLLKLTQDMGAKLAEDQLDNLFEKFPLIQKHLEYVLNGGDSQNFMQAYDPQLDYSKMEVSENDVQVQKSVLGEYFKLKGHDKEFIDELLEDYQDSGKLLNKAKAAKDALTKMQTQQREELTAKQADQRKQQETQQKEFWNGIRKTIDDSEEFSGIVVPKREKSKFYDYISSPINKNGQTQRDLDHSDASMDVKLAIDYLMFKGFKLDDIINTKAKTKSARSLRDKISRNDDKVKSARGATRRKSASFDIDDLDLSI
tara:strand:+ start:7649 stop:8728 length:1080 start_codon:yes stop_codon:yes gene_type:complete